MVSPNHTVRAKMLLIKCTAGSQVLIQEFFLLFTLRNFPKPITGYCQFKNHAN